VHSIEKHFDAITALAISLDDTILVTGLWHIFFFFSIFKLIKNIFSVFVIIEKIASLDKSVKRWSFEDMQVIDTISTIYSPVTSMVITCDNTFVIIGK
jgi:hypothetical protein